MKGETKDKTRNDLRRCSEKLLWTNTIISLQHDLFDVQLAAQSLIHSYYHPEERRSPAYTQTE